MKNPLLILFSFCVGIVYGQDSRFMEGETLYVWAFSGLIMRTLPDAKAEKIEVLPYGTKVVVQSNIGIKVTHEVEEFKGFKVKGIWLLVKYGDNEGFVFDGYLSRLIAPDKNSKLENYLTQKIGKIGQPMEVYSQNTINNIENVSDYKQKYNFGIEFQHHSGETYWDKTTIPNISLYEGYFLFKATSAGLIGTKPTIVNSEILFDKEIEGGFVAGSIKKVGDKIIISLAWGC